MSMLIFPALLLLSAVLRPASAEDSVPTFEHQDPVTGETLNCTMCPAGTHMAAPCTPSTATRCEPCGGQYFTELWNYLPRCLYCHNFCFGNQEVERECFPSGNRLCRCKQGFYSEDDFCVPHSECGPGHGVQTSGSSKLNTVCEKCPGGYYSSSSSALDTCVKHQDCLSGQIMLLHGSAYQDTLCGSCEELANRVMTLRTFLSRFFSAHKMRVGKMKKFVTRYIHTPGGERCDGDSSVPKERGPLLDQIREWLQKAPEDELRKTPQMLRTCQLNSMAERLEKKLNEITQHRQNCNLSS